MLPIMTFLTETSQNSSSLMKLDASTISKIEGYLAHKWGLQDSLPTSHAHSLGAPLASSGTPDYIADTPFGSGKAIDLINGHVEIPHREAENVFDGSTSFSVSAWIKGGSKQALGSIVSSKKVEVTTFLMLPSPCGSTYPQPIPSLPMPMEKWYPGKTLLTPPLDCMGIQPTNLIPG